MTDDLVMSLQQLQRYAAGVQDLLAQAQAGVPERVEATDASGAVRAVLGPDGLPESIVVEPGWQRSLAADGFPTAVMEACQAAAGERLAGFSQALHDEGAHLAPDRLREHLAEQTEPAPVDPLPAELRDQVNHVQPRPLEDLVEEVLRAADDVDALAAASPLAAVGTGTDASGRLTVTVSQAGLLSVEAQPRWLAKQSGQALTAALSEAIGAARADLAHASQRTGNVSGLDQLLAEALALLNDLQPPARS